jgi:hypothetical protein
MSKTFDHVDYLTHMVNKLDKENKELRKRLDDLEKLMKEEDNGVNAFILG